jgi:acyl-CoA synthetase (AMP-forming)/AMP-acid ligase II
MTIECASIAEVLRHRARTCAERPALNFEDRITTYGSLDRNANRVAQALLRSGVQPQDRVATLTKNSAVFFDVLGGAAKARVCLAPINFRLSIDEIAFILGDMQPKLLFVGRDLTEAARAALAKSQATAAVIELDAPDEHQTSYARWRNLGMDVDPTLAESAEDDVFLLYTSGTTGRPKGVRIMQSNYAAMLRTFPSIPGFSYKEGEIVANAMPLFHIAGINVGVSTLSQGGTLLPIAEFRPPSMLRMIETAKINHAFLAPAMIAALLQAPEAERTDFSSLATISYGAAPIAPDILEQAQRRFGCDFVQLYGMTESTGAGTLLDPASHRIPRRQGSCGIPWPGMDIGIVDPNGVEVPPHTVGELVMKGPFVSPGYRNQPEATRASRLGDWLRTGDAAYRDEEGFIFIHDRIKDMIVTGGENVYAAEVERALLEHPAVAEAAVIGVPDDRWGEEVKAIVVLEPGARTRPEEIIAWTKARIASYKAPKSIDFVPVLPRNAAGKLLRRELRAPYWAGRTRQVN